MTEKIEQEFSEWWAKYYSLYSQQNHLAMRDAYLAGRKANQEKIKETILLIATACEECGQYSHETEEAIKILEEIIK